MQFNPKEILDIYTVLQALQASTKEHISLEVQLEKPVKNEVTSKES